MWSGVSAVDQRRLLVVAAVPGVRAARGEAAARRRVDEVGRPAGDRRAAACGCGSSSLGMLSSSASVYGIFMSANSVVRRRLLDELAAVHHGDLVGVPGDDAEVVGDEDHRHVAVLALLARCRSRICACTVTSSAVVGSSANSSVGPQARAMAIITRWRMPPDSSCGYCSRRRAGLGDARRRASSRSAVALRVVAAHVEVDLQRLGDLLADLHHRVQRRHRVLEDHRHLRAPDVAHLLGARGRSSSWPSKRTEPVRVDVALAASRPMIERDEHGLAGARLADDAERLAAVEREATRRRPPARGRAACWK